MSDPTGPPRTAAEVRARNAGLDDQLRHLAEGVTPDWLHVAPVDGEWTPAELLGHLAEFPRYFADDLRRQLREEGAVVGRTHEHPGRNAAIGEAAGRDLETLRASLDASLDELAAVLDTLRDEHLGRVGNNRKYGPETLAVFLERYVLGHKESHITQLQRTLDTLPG